MWLLKTWRPFQYHPGESYCPVSSAKAGLDMPARVSSADGKNQHPLLTLHFVELTLPQHRDDMVVELSSSWEHAHIITPYLPDPLIGLDLLTLEGSRLSTWGGTAGTRRSAAISKLAVVRPGRTNLSMEGGCGLGWGVEQGEMSLVFVESGPMFRSGWAEAEADVSGVRAVEGGDLLGDGRLQHRGPLGSCNSLPFFFLTKCVWFGT